MRADNQCNEENFRKDVKDLMQRENAHLVVSYSRPALKQTGLNLMQQIKRRLFTSRAVFFRNGKILR